ncbi:MAG: hypothetical protein J0L97_04370 [Alphaproteobacteria bacterium]|nr:hypothetical protein [Alphaproteobacteria bacterium]
MTTTDLIGYDKLIDQAMRGVVHDALKIVEKKGFSGRHHCYISFATRHPGVSIAQRLKERYPEEMTIVLQHQFWDLNVAEDFFSVVLSFNNIREKLVIPYAALTAFADPSVKFGLQFQTELPHAPSEATTQTELPGLDETTEKGTSAASAGSKGLEPGKVITLDTFRKK